jgi:hypothetical protein
MFSIISVLVRKQQWPSFTSSIRKIQLLWPKLISYWNRYLCKQCFCFPRSYFESCAAWRTTVLRNLYVICNDHCRDRSLLKHEILHHLYSVFCRKHYWVSRLWPSPNISNRIQRVLKIPTRKRTQILFPNCYSSSEKIDIEQRVLSFSVICKKWLIHSLCLRFLYVSENPHILSLAQLLI